MNLILLGAPGAGKGTQAELLTEKLGIPAISTGNMLREMAGMPSFSVSNETETGRKVKYYMDNGLLVPDDVILAIVRDRVSCPDCAAGFILDGVPRTIAQAQSLDELGVRIDHVISIEIEDAVIEARMSGRRVCSACGASYHVAANPPKTEGICDLCGGKLTVREDDAPETVRRRLAVYHQQTEALKGFYQKLGKLRLVEGNQPIEDANRAILGAIGA